MAEYVTKDACEELRTACPVKDKVEGKDGLQDQFHKLDLRLTRLEVLIPVATVILLKLLDWGLARLSAAAAQAAQHVP
jgi:hypothetical protein